MHGAGRLYSCTKIRFEPFQQAASSFRCRYSESRKEKNICISSQLKIENEIQTKHGIEMENFPFATDEAFVLSTAENISQ